MSRDPEPCEECAARFYIGTGCPDDALAAAAESGDAAALRVREFRRFMAGAISAEPGAHP